MRRRPMELGAALAASLLLSACGSTVAQSTSSGGALQQGTAPGFSAPAGGSAPPGTTGLGATGGAATGGGALDTSGSGGGVAGGGTGQTGSGAVTGSGASAGGGSAGSGGTAFTGPGVTDSTIPLGIPYCNDCAAANAAAGAGGDDPGDTRRYYQAAIDDVNSRGGVQGRKLVPVFHPFSVSDNVDTSQQAACETFTKDHKVMMIFLRGDIIFQCALKAGVLVVGDGGSGPTYQRFPNLIDPATIRQERLGAVTVKAMVKAGWHKPAAKWPTGKIGLVTWADDNYRYAMDHGWLPALHGAGLKETDVRYVEVPQSDRSLADAGAGISSAVLAFRQQGIDHVFIADGPAGVFRGTGLTLLFLNNAKSQNYYPRYGFNTYNSPGWEQLPADQEAGMLAIDGFDTARRNDEGIALNPPRERCFALMRKKALTVNEEKDTAALALGACEIAWFAEAVLKQARNGDLRSMIAAGESLGTSYRSPYIYGTRLGPNQHDGSALFRNARFDDACACMKYTSKPYEP